MHKFKGQRRVALPCEQAHIEEALAQLSHDFKATVQYYAFDPNLMACTVTVQSDEQGIILIATCSTKEIICVGN